MRLRSVFVVVVVVFVSMHRSHQFPGAVVGVVVRSVRVCCNDVACVGWTGSLKSNNANGGGGGSLHLHRPVGRKGRTLCIIIIIIFITIIITSNIIIIITIIKISSLAFEG